jgi:hypothetical protein
MNVVRLLLVLLGSCIISCVLVDLWQRHLKKCLDDRKQNLNDWKRIPDSSRLHDSERYRQLRRELRQRTILDSSYLIQKVETIRNDPAGAVHARLHSAARQTALVSRVQNSSSRLPYFERLRLQNQSSIPPEIGAVPEQTDT